MEIVNHGKYSEYIYCAEIALPINNTLFCQDLFHSYIYIPVYFLVEFGKIVICCNLITAWVPLTLEQMISKITERLKLFSHCQVILVKWLPFQYKKSFHVDPMHFIQCATIKNLYFQLMNVDSTNVTGGNFLWFVSRWGAYWQKCHGARKSIASEASER